MSTVTSQVAAVSDTAPNRPKPLLVTALREEDIHDAMELLQSAGLPLTSLLLHQPGLPTKEMPPSALSASDQVTQWVNQNPSGHLLLLIPDPVLDIAEALCNKIRPTDAVMTWSASAELALATVRTVGRHRCSVFVANGMRTSAQGFLKRLGERLGLNLVESIGKTSIDATHEVSKPLDQSKPLSLFTMMAENALWQTQVARMQMSELLALAVPVGSSHSVDLAAVEEVFSSHLEEQESHKRRVETELKSDRTALEQTRAKLTVLEKENDLLLQQLQHIQEELEQYYLQQVKTSRLRVIELEAKINALLNSKSWKMTRPWRAILGVLTGNKATL